MKYLQILLIIIVAFSCENSTEFEQINCDNLSSGLLRYNTDIVKNEINKLCKDLTPHVSEDDKFGHKENINILVNRINTQCRNIEAELGCYACIYTNPPQSHISVTVDSVGTHVGRVIDIWTSADAKLSVVRVH